MFEILLSLCLAQDPGRCWVETHRGGATYADCVAEAERLWRAAPAVPQAWPCVAAGGEDPFPVTEIAPGVFVHKGRQAEAGQGNAGDISNFGFVIGRDAVALIDAGGSAQVARAALAAIRARTDLPVRWVILTHMHPDHSLGAPVFAAAGATIVGHRRLPRALAARRDSYLAAGARLMGGAFAGTTLPDVIEVAPAEIDLGARVLRLEGHQTGHTDNDLSVLDVETGTWFVGDILFVGHTPALDGSITGWIDLVDSLTAREVARAVPGHGPVSVAWPAAAGAMQSYLKDLAAQTRRAIAEGRPMLQAIETVDAGQDDGWLMYELFHPRNVSAAFKELEWE